MIAGLEERSFFADLFDADLPTLTFFLTSASHTAYSLFRS